MKAAAIVAALALGAASAAAAQRVVTPGPGASYPPPQPNVYYPPLPPAPVQPVPVSRWGNKVGGRWWGGANAPGGWAAYRAPQRGERLPGYWVSPRFYVSDWNAYGFRAPLAGQYWTRYYDDAVLIDGRGAVIDTVGGVDWDSHDRAYAADDRARRDRDGVGGAVAGAVVGGVAGNVIAGRGNRLGGTLIGAGVGAAAGYALGSAGDTRHGPRDRGYSAGDTRRGPPPAESYDYREPLPPYDEPFERRMHDMGPGPGYPPADHWVSSDGRTTVTVTTGGGVPVVYAPAWGYGGTVTTVTVQTMPVTTTTSEIVEDQVTYTRPVVRRVYKRRVWRPHGKLLRRR